MSNEWEWDTLPMNHSGTEPCWNDPQLAYDGDITTYAFSNPVPPDPGPGPGFWTCYLILNLETPFTCDQLRYGLVPLASIGHQAWTRSNGVWDWPSFSWQPPHWMTLSFSERAVTAVRWRFQNRSLADMVVSMYEAQFWLRLERAQTYFFLA